MTPTRAELARLVDHTRLAPTATLDEVHALLTEAQELGTYSICVSPSMLPLPWPTGAVLVATVCGFPSGKHTPHTKAAEAAESVANGADEVDMVIDLGRLKAGDAAHTQDEIRRVREAVDAAASGRRPVLKVIIESAALTDEQIVAVCRASADAGADFVKTSTGFHPAGGASAHAVELMRRTVGDALGVKASGGIRSWDAAVQMVEAGASRLGLSGTAAVLAGGSADGDY